MKESSSTLRRLRTWVDKHQSELVKLSYQIEFSESPADRAKKSALLTISSPCRLGQLVLWETGEATLSLGGISFSEVSEQHRKITSQIGLIDAIETLMEWVGADYRKS